jgi:pyruvate dehydrogenase E1 component
MDEGNIFEALLEGWKHGLQNCWWIIDYNRQSLDAVIREGRGSASRLSSRISAGT